VKEVEIIHLLLIQVELVAVVQEVKVLIKQEHLLELQAVQVLL
tara:strand:- start:143 stop:271 length:129 start_codon:yes stop_codon:yes gene_type:complete